MGSRLNREEIYDALLNDEALQRLPHLMATAYGGRSCTLHWWHSNGASEVISHNGYFTDDHFHTYAEHFTQADDWSLAGLNPNNVNKVVNCDDVVSDSTYARGAFYNDWIRGMGDDTFHCIGTAIKTKWGTGFVGVHRGRTQGSFDEEKIQGLREDIVHLRRTLIMRGRILGTEARASQSEAVLDQIGDAFITLLPDGRVIHANAAAEHIMRRRDGLEMAAGRLRACAGRSDRALQHAIHRGAHPSDAAITSVSALRSDGRRCDLSVVPLYLAAGQRRVLVAIRDPEIERANVASRLRDLYGLTPSEADIAVQLSQGASLAEIAELRQVAVGTVRFQLKSVMHKLDCKRQTQVVATVLNLTVLRAGGRGPQP